MGAKLAPIASEKANGSINTNGAVIIKPLLEPLYKLNNLIEI